MKQKQRISQPPALTVRDFMSTDVATLSPDMSLREAIEVLADRRITGAPVVAANRIVGVLSGNDVLAFEAATPGVPAGHYERSEHGELETPEEQQWEEGSDAPSAYFTEFWADAGADVVERLQALEGPEWDMLGEHTVSEAMSTGVRTVPVDASLPQAAAYLLKHGLHRAVVVDGERPVGIITATDFVRAVAVAEARA
jgi:CBS domain-containing protein